MIYSLFSKKRSWMGIWLDSSRYLTSRLFLKQKRTAAHCQTKENSRDRVERTRLVWLKTYLTPCRASRSAESFVLRSCSSCSCLWRLRSSCWASTLMSFATTTAVWRSAWNLRHSSFSSWRHKHETYCTSFGWVCDYIISDVLYFHTDSHWRAL